MTRKNYKDDFDFILHLYSCLMDAGGKEVADERKELDWPAYDWTARFYTSSKANAYTASCIGGTCTNCYNDGGKIHIVVNNHRMGPGKLKVEFRAELPRDIYPDGFQRNVIPGPLDVELVTGRGDLPADIEASLMVPYIKGEPFTFDDFTPRQLEDIIQGAARSVTIDDLGVATDEEVDRAMAQLTEIGDIGAATRSGGYRIDPRIRRGIIPAKARPGIVYRNYGYVRVAPYRGDGKIQMEFDMTPFSHLINKDYHDEHYRLEEDGDRLKLIFEPGDHIGAEGYSALVPFNGGGDFSGSRGYVFIGSDGYATVCRDLQFVYEPKLEFTDEELRRAHDAFESLNPGAKPGRYQFRCWRSIWGGKRQNKRRRFCAVSTRHDHAHYHLYAVRIRNSKGYKSEWRKIWVTSTDSYILT